MRVLQWRGELRGGGWRERFGRGGCGSGGGGGGGSAPKQHTTAQSTIKHKHKHERTATPKRTTHTYHKKPQEPARVLGRVKIDLLPVAAAGRVRGKWPLQGALSGQLEMALEWIDAGDLV